MGSRRKREIGEKEGKKEGGRVWGAGRRERLRKIGEKEAERNIETQGERERNKVGETEIDRNRNFKLWNQRKREKKRKNDE